LNSELSDAMEKHMKKIVFEESRPFSFKDFLSFEVDGKWYSATEGTTRNKFSQFSKEKKIELCYRTKIAFYTLPGIKFGKDRLMTPNPKEDNNYNNTVIHHTHLINQPIYKILESTPFDERAIHNIHLKFKVSKLYELVSNTANPLLTKDPSNENKAIMITYYDIDKFTIIITINKNDTVTVVVGCSENPVALDFNGINRLSNALTRIEERLSNLIASAAPLVDCKNNKFHDQIIVPSHKNWIITLWHIGRDSLYEYSKEMFHCKWDIAEKIILRIYSKELTNGKKKVRIELQQNPQIDIETLQKSILNKIIE
jgi:hypothetical protein